MHTLQASAPHEHAGISSECIYRKYASQKAYTCRHRQTTGSKYIHLQASAQHEHAGISSERKCRKYASHDLGDVRHTLQASARNEHAGISSECMYAASMHHGRY
eukprot:scaffold149532_cov22-Tisochrysis_lutea.AAC.2